jgi:hypothetical protein
VQLRGHLVVEDRRDERDVLVEVADQQRDPQRQRVLAGGDADDVEAPVGERAPDRVVVGVRDPPHLGARLLEREADLLEEVAFAGEQDASAIGHGRSVSATSLRPSVTSRFSFRASPAAGEGARGAGVAGSPVVGREVHEVMRFSSHPAIPGCRRSRIVSTAWCPDRSCGRWAWTAARWRGGSGADGCIRSIAGCTRWDMRG